MPWRRLIEENVVLPLSNREWNLMREYYPESHECPPMRLVSPSPSNVSELIFSPPNDFFQVCETCYEEIEIDRLKFKNVHIYIRHCPNAETAIKLDSEMVFIPSST